MKKSFLLIVPAILVLTGCSFNVRFINNTSIPAGFEKGSGSLPGGYESVNYSYTSNGSLNEEGLSKTTLTFTDISKSESDITNNENIYAIMHLDNEGLNLVIENKPKYFNTKNEGFAYLGNSVTDEYGEITFVASKQIKGVSIKAKQYYYTDTSFNEYGLVIDDNVAVAINDSGFVKLNDPVLNEEKDQITNYTECVFNLEEATDHITIKAGRNRAILQEVSFYY